jgi:hypothetical protein
MEAVGARNTGVTRFVASYAIAPVLGGLILGGAGEVWMGRVCRSIDSPLAVLPLASNAALEPRDGFETDDAQTPRNTGHHPGPEDKASQQNRQLREICKTSIPGSNPGGASIFLSKIDRLFVPGTIRRAQTVRPSVAT